MANIRSQKKRALTNAKKNLKNTAERSRLKTSIKKVTAQIAAGNKEEAQKAYNECSCLLDRAQVHGLKHRNYVAREKSRLAKAINAMS